MRDDVLEKMLDYNLASFIEDFLDSKGDCVEFNNDIGQAVCCCPIHGENTPSFDISYKDGTYLWYCHGGCKAGGNIFNFVINYTLEHENRRVEFVEAMEIVSDITGIAMNTKKKKQSKVYLEYVEMMEEAQEVYTKTLYSEMEDEDSDINDFINTRGLNFITSDKISILDEFGIGLVPNSKSEYERFGVADCRNRLSIPLPSMTNKGQDIVAFCYRTILDVVDPTELRERDKERKANKKGAFGKYTGSRNSESDFYGEDVEVGKKRDGNVIYQSRFKDIYVKNNYLYNFARAMPYVRKEEEVIIVEGALDTISLFKCNVRNVVSSLTCKISDEMIELISKKTKSVIIWYDKDEAGHKALKATIPKFKSLGCDVYVCDPIYGGDPDDCAKKLKFNEKAMRKFIRQNKIDGMEFLIDRYVDIGIKQMRNIKKTILKDTREMTQFLEGEEKEDIRDYIKRKLGSV